MAKSIKTNYIFNLITTISGLLFPLITFPYSSRIIMAEGIGQINFYSSIINYICLFSSIGIPMYAIRESARVRDNREQLSIVSSEILILHTILSVCAYFVVAILCCSVPQVRANIPLFLIISLSIIFNTIGCEWLYKGVEDFKYITIRGLCMKIFFVIMLFTFVKTKDDLLLYGLFSVLGSAGSNVYNLIRIRKHIDFHVLRITNLNPWRHLKPALHIFILNIITSIYLNLDTVMLGFLKDSSSVGYYTAATKINHMLMGIVSSLGAVMVPRLSNLYKVGNISEFNRLAQKSIDYVIAVSLPISLGLIIMAPELIQLFAGESYYPAITTLQIIAPVILIIGVSNVMGIQVLYPQDKVNLVIISTGVGAIVNFSLNYILIPVFAQNGAALATIVGETVVTLTMFLIAKKYMPFSVLKKRYLVYALAGAIMVASCLFIRQLNFSHLVNTILIPIIGGLIYLLLLLLFNDYLLLEVINMIKIRIPYIKK